MYRTDCVTAHPVLPNRLSKVNTSCGLPCRSSFMSDFRVLMAPPECRPGQLAYTFLIRILSTPLASVSIYSVFCYSSVSISMGQTDPLALV
jgi:hypothetical protein